MSSPSPRAGWRSLGELSRYHWFVFIVASSAWVLDCMDQQLFNLARQSAMEELTKKPVDTDSRVVEVYEKSRTQDQERQTAAKALNDAAAGKAKKDGVEAPPTISPDDAKVDDKLKANALAKIRAADVKENAGYATSIFLIGWAFGGLFFGVMGDRSGRVRTLTTTIVMYSFFTGFSAFSVGVWDFMLYRFLTGLGVGGVFAVAVALIAETVPDRPRPFALGLLQASSAIGNCTAAGCFVLLGQMKLRGDLDNLVVWGTKVEPWRLMFLVGVLPALLAIIVQLRLKEPEKWRQAVAEGKSRKAGSFRELFGEPKLARHAIFGLLLAFAGVVGLWGIGFFSIDLQQSVLGKTLAAEASAKGLTGDEAQRYITSERLTWAGITSLMLNVGACLGMFAFSWLTSFTGRKPAFFLTFILAAGSTVLVFQKLQTRDDILWMLPLMGFCQLALFGGYAIYFPELFPTRLRSTGTSFCYNVGRLVAAVGPAALGLLTSRVFNDSAEPMRPAGTVMCSVFLLGLVALPFLPETKDKPLPE